MSGSPPVPPILTHTRSDGTKVIYKIQEKLGKGGFATVYAAISIPGNEKVAIKCTDKAIVESRKLKKKLATEIEIHKSLHHRNIVKFIANFQDQHYMYFVLELCKGGNVMDLLRKKKYFDEIEAGNITKQMLSALAYLHKKKIIHRDVKINNFLIGDNGVIKLCDFGLSVYSKDLKNETNLPICGTPSYVSPEIVAKTHTHTYAVDIWAMGISVFVMLTGHPPFRALKRDDTYKKIKKGVYAWPNHPIISESAKYFVDSMLKTNPYERPSADILLIHPWLSKKKISPIETKPLLKKSCSMQLCEMGERDVEMKTHDSFHTLTPNSINNNYSMNANNNNNNNNNSSFAISSNNNNYESIGNNNNSSSMSPNYKLRFPTPGSLSPYSSPKNVIPLNLNGINIDANQPVAMPSDSDITPSPRTSTPASQRYKRSRSISFGRGSASPRPFQSALQTHESTEKRSPSLKDSLSNLEIAKNKTSFSASARPGFLHKSIGNFANEASKSNDKKSRTMNKNSQKKFPSNAIRSFYDNRSKYGLAYLLENGVCGCIFNDGSRLVLDSDGQFCQYYKSPHDQMEVIQVDSSDKHIKKVSLIKNISKELQSRNNLPQKAKQQDCNEPITHVKYWTASDKGTLFKMSNKNYQAVFSDKSRVYVYNQTKFVYFDDKHKVVKTTLGALQNKTTLPELQKRMSYMKHLGSAFA